MSEDLLAPASPGVRSQLPSADEKAALGGTDGTPSGVNPFVTDSDPRLGDVVTVAASFVHDFLFL